MQTFAFKAQQHHAPLYRQAVGYIHSSGFQSGAGHELAVRCVIDIPFVGEGATGRRTRYMYHMAYRKRTRRLQYA